MKNRPIKPNVVTTFDNPIVQVKCDPTEDEVNVDEILRQVLTRFEFVLGTSFDLQFLTLDGSRILALRRYIVIQVTEEIVTSNVNHYQTMTKTVYHRTYKPLGELLIFDEIAAVLSNQLRRRLPKKTVDIDKMNVAELQSTMKSVTGKGFPPGTSRADMVEGVRAHL